MDIGVFIEEFGIPITVACAFGYFIWKQNHWIQEELMEELDESFKRIEAIIIKLIDQSKISQMDIKEQMNFDPYLGRVTENSAAQQPAPQG